VLGHGHRLGSRPPCSFRAGADLRIAPADHWLSRPFYPFCPLFLAPPASLMTGGSHPRPASVHGSVGPDLADVDTVTLRVPTEQERFFRSVAEACSEPPQSGGGAMAQFFWRVGLAAIALPVRSEPVWPLGDAMEAGHRPLCGARSAGEVRRSQMPVFSIAGARWTGDPGGAACCFADRHGDRCCCWVCAERTLRRRVRR